MKTKIFLAFLVAHLCGCTGQHFSAFVEGEHIAAEQCWNDGGDEYQTGVSGGSNHHVCVYINPKGQLRR